jgi:hypothetical protein
MLGFLAGDRAGTMYGTKRLVILGGTWWTFWILLGGFFVRIRDINDCLKLAFIGGSLASVDLQLLLSAHVPQAASICLVALGSVLGAQHGGQSVARISQFGGGLFFWG